MLNVTPTFADMTYTIERKIYGEWRSYWVPVESFEDKAVADKELSHLCCRYNHDFRITTNN